VAGGGQLGGPSELARLMGSDHGCLYRESIVCTNRVWKPLPLPGWRRLQGASDQGENVKWPGQISRGEQRAAPAFIPADIQHTAAHAAPCHAVPWRGMPASLCEQKQRSSPTSTDRRGGHFRVVQAAAITIGSRSAQAPKPAPRIGEEALQQPCLNHDVDSVARNNKFSGGSLRQCSAWGPEGQAWKSPAQHPPAGVDSR
jgi:hypothetical protein